jgi:hypothetical protein
VTAYDDAITALGSDIVRYWPLDDASGTTADDRKNAADGTITGSGITYAAAGILREQNGLQTSAASSGEVTLPSSGLTGAGTIFGWYQTTEDGLGFILRDHTTSAGFWFNPFDAQARTPTGILTITAVPEPYLSSGRKFVMLTLSGTTLGVHIDGKHVQDLATTSTLSDLASPLHLGRNGNLSTYTSTRVAGWGVASRVLTEAEGLALFEAGRRHQVNFLGFTAAFGSTSGTPSIASLPTHSAGSGSQAADLLMVVAFCKPSTAGASASINQGWTLVKRVTGGTGALAADAGDMSAFVFAKLATSSSETPPTITWGGTAPSPALIQAFSYRLDPGATWADTLGTDTDWVQSASDTTTTTPITGTTGSFSEPPAPGDVVMSAFGIPTDAGSAITSPSASIAGLTSFGSLPAFIDTSQGNDAGQGYMHLWPHTGTASAGVAASYAVTSAADLSGILLGIAIRQVIPDDGSDLTGAATTELPTASGSLAGFNASTVTGAATTVNPTAAGVLESPDTELSGAATTVNPTAAGTLNSTGEVTVTGAATTVNPTAAGVLEGFNASAVTGAVTTVNPTAAGVLTAESVADLTGAVTTELPTAAGSLNVEEIGGTVCLDLNDALILFETGTIVDDELVPDVVGNLYWLISLPTLSAGLRYDWDFGFTGGDYAESDIDSTIGIYATTGTDVATAEADVSSWYTLIEETGPHSATPTVRIDPDDHADYADLIADDRVYFVFSAPTQSTVTSLCYTAVDPDTLPPEIIEPEPVEIDTALVEVPPVDQEDHEAEWHDYPAVGTLATGGAWDVAFVLDGDGNKIEARKVRDRDRIFAKNGDGAWDITVVNGKRTQMADYQLMKPFTYGPGSLSVPGLNPILDDMSAYPWLSPWTKVFVQRVDDEGAITSTDWRGRITSIDLSGADVTLDLGGMFSAPAAVQWRPKPLVRRREKPTYWLHAMFRKNRMPLDEVDLGFDQVTSPPQGWHLNCALDVVAGAVKRNGDALTVTYDETAKQYVSQLVDRDTIHATVYLDHGLMRPELTRDFSAEKNEVYASGHDEDGDKILFAVAPGMEQVTPVPDYPLASGDPFGEGTVDADTTDGAGISRLLLRLITLGYLRRDDKSGGFDADAGLAVADARVDAKLDDYGLGDPTLEQVDEDLWAWLWDADATGLTMKEARIRPAYQVPALGAYNFTATGQLKGANLAYDPALIPVSEVVDFTTSMRKGQMKKRARRYVFDGPNWSGTITASVTGVIAGEHNPGDAFTSADVLSTRDVREGWNLWVPNFEGGTLFHVSGVDVSQDGFDVRFMVDTQARDTLTINEILDRQEQNRLSPSKAFWKQASGNFGKDTITGSLGEIGGKIGTDVFCPAGQWTVLPIPVGDYGTISQIRTRLRAYTEDTETTFEGSSPNASGDGLRHMTMVFGRDVRTNNDTRESAFLDARRPNPFAAGDLDDVKDAIDDFKDRNILGSWGGEDVSGEITYCGYGDFSSDGTTLSGNFFDDSGFPFRAPDCVAYVAVYVATDAVFLSGRVLWWSLDEGT